MNCMNSMISEFQDWVERIREEVNEVDTLLGHKLSDEPQQLIRDLEVIETWNSRMGFLLAEANSYLDKGKYLLLPDKEGKTEFDRKVSLDHAVSEIRQWRDRIESICDSIKQRLILGESILGFYKQFADRKSTELGVLY